MTRCIYSVLLTIFLWTQSHAELIRTDAILDSMSTTSLSTSVRITDGKTSTPVFRLRISNRQLEWARQGWSLRVPALRRLATSWRQIVVANDARPPVSSALRQAESRLPAELRFASATFDRDLLLAENNAARWPKTDVTDRNDDNGLVLFNAGPSAITLAVVPAIFAFLAIVFRQIHQPVSRN